MRGMVVEAKIVVKNGVADMVEAKEVLQAARGFVR